MITDSSSHSSTESGGESIKQCNENDKENDVARDSQMDDVIATFMGDNPTKNSISEADMLQEVAIRIDNWIKNGIPKDERLQIVRLAPRDFKDCKLITPKLNEEIKCNLKEDAIKRDGYFFCYHDIIGASLSLSASLFSMVLNDKKEPLDRDVVLQHLLI